MNVAVLQGVLSSAPFARVLASGSVLVTLEVTTRDDAGSCATVPVAWFDPPGQPELAAGDEVLVVGVVRRRFFRSSGATQSRTEVVAAEVVDPARRRAARAALQRAGVQMGGAGAVPGSEPRPARRVRSA